jgi:hypothetical protein
MSTFFGPVNRKMAETCKGRKCGDAYQLTEGGLKFYKAAQCKKLCPPGSTSGLCKACDAAMASNMASGTKKFHGTVNAPVPNWSHIYDREAGAMSKWGIEKAALELKKTAGETVAVAKSAVASATAVAGPKSAPVKAAKAAVVKAVAAETVAKKAVVSVADFLANVRKEAAAAERKEEAAVAVVEKAVTAVVGAEKAVVKAVRKTAKRQSSSNRGSIGAAGRRSPNMFASSSSANRGSRRATGSRATNTFTSSGTLGYNRAARPVTPESERKLRKKTRKAQFGWKEQVSKKPFRVSRTPSEGAASENMNFRTSSGGDTMYEWELPENRLPGAAGTRAPQPSPAASSGSSFKDVRKPGAMIPLPTGMSYF